MTILMWLGIVTASCAFFYLGLRLGYSLDDEVKKISIGNLHEQENLR